MTIHKSQGSRFGRVVLPPQAPVSNRMVLVGAVGPWMGPTALRFVDAGELEELLQSRRCRERYSLRPWDDDVLEEAIPL